MRLTLEKIRLENFKGCRSLELDFSAGNTKIAGANGTGKTTIVDAFCWVLWNKDSNGNAPGSDAFREKPLDENGNTIHNLDTTVELFCTLDGQRFDIKRRQVENWVKKRGNAEATFQGNVSTYWINGVEIKQNDFKARIRAIADEEVVRNIGSLSAFNAQEWKARRQQLLNLAGEDVDGELLARDEYRPIADEIAQRGIEVDDLKKVLADQRKAINNELKMLPAYIAGAKEAMPKFGKTEIKDAEYYLADTLKTIEEVDRQIMEQRMNGGEAESRNRVLMIEQEIVSIKRRISDEYDAGKRRLQAEASEASEAFRRYSAEVSRARTDAEAEDGKLKRAQAKRDELRARYMDVKRAPVTVSEICPTCGQPLPADKLDEVKARAEQQKRETLAEIQTLGKAAAQEVAEHEQRLDEATKRMSEAGERVRAAEGAREAANAALKDYAPEPDYTADKAFTDALERLMEAKAERAGSSDEKLAELLARKKELQDKAEGYRATLSRRDVAVDSQKRVEMYESQQREQGARLSEVEVLIELTERFVIDRCAALEDSINSHFPTVRWKLFDKQINGGIVDTCVALLDCDGAMVPYESANTASQVAADMEIVDVLSKHYDVRVPLFVDNAERVVKLPHIESQTITLTVSTDSELNIKEA